MRLFISYPREDKTETLQLFKVLTDGGHEVWIDDGLQAGQAWEQQLRDEILKADAIVLCLTQNWLDSPYCNWEFVVAVEAGKKVIPVLLKKREDGTLPEIPQRISKYQWADFTGGMDDAAKTQKFLEDVSALGVPSRDGVTILGSEFEENELVQQPKFVL